VLHDVVARLLDDELARHPAADDPRVASLQAVRRALDGALVVAVAGWMKAGKSTLLNALVGAELAATDAGECTRILTVYRWSDRPRAAGVDRDGRLHPLDVRVGERGLEIDTSAGPDDLARLEVGWPLDRLRDLVLVDTPGLESPTPDLSARTRRALQGELAGFGIDAVIYLVRHLHPADVGFLEAFAAAPRAEAGPVNAVAVLARADELGGGRGDGSVAARVADRYRRDPRLRRLVQTVVPVNALLAVAAGTLDDADRAVIAALASLEPTRRTRATASAEVLLRSELPAGAPPAARASVMARLGPAGLRLAVDLVAADPDLPGDALRAALRAHSNIGAVEELLADRFTARADLLKARAALTRAQRIAARTPGPDGTRFAAAVEEVAAHAHELVELAQLTVLRQAPPPLERPLLDEAERLLGGHGSSDAARLSGVDPAACVERWRTLAEQPWGDLSVQRLARVVVRTVESLAARQAP
jgi:hypothetical protein